MHQTYRTALMLTLLAACSGNPSEGISVSLPAATELAIQRVPNARPGHYITLFTNDVRREEVRALSELLTAEAKGRLEFVYEHALHGFAAELDEDAALKIARDPRVAQVAQDGIIETATTQTSATWGLDRVDQRTLPVSSSYRYNSTGNGVHVYVIDSGVRTTHQEFGGRAVHGVDVTGDNVVFCPAAFHGSHVAATVAGTTYGVAKKATIHSVKVFACDGVSPPQATFDSRVIAGVDWVTANRVLPAVANMSLGRPVAVPGNTYVDNLIDLAVQGSINSGVTYVIAAGNRNWDAFQTTPARLPAAITVGATDVLDARALFGGAGGSNFGPALDVFAPGKAILSASSESDTATRLLAGTSMASPHVAGEVARFLETATDAAPADAHAFVVKNATTGVVTDAGAGSPNRLLYAPFSPFAFVANLGGNSVSIISTEPLANVGTVAAPSLAGPFNIALRETHARGYVTAMQTGHVYVLNTAQRTNGALIKLCRTATCSTADSTVAARGIAISASRQRAYVALGGANKVAVVDLDPSSPAFEKQVAVVDVGYGPMGVAVTSDGALAYVSNVADSTISEIDTDTDTVVRSYPSGGTAPFAVALRHLDGALWVANASSNSVTELNNGVVTRTITGLSNPRGLAVSPNSKVLWVTNYADNTLRSFSASNLALLSTVATPALPYGVQTAWDSEGVTRTLAGTYGGASVINNAGQTAAAGSGPVRPAIECAPSQALCGVCVCGEALNGCGTGMMACGGLGGTCGAGLTCDGCNCL